MKDDIYERLYNQLEADDVLTQTIEELAELTQALCKLKRIDTVNPPKGDTDSIVHNVLEEVADVKNLLRLLTCMPWYEGEVVWEIRIQKMARWERRLKNEAD